MKRIVGGRGAGPGLFPWQVLLSVEDQSRVPEGRWFGSGALLTPRWVLTAAHVLLSQRKDASVVPVAPQHVQVSKALLHITFDPWLLGIANHCCPPQALLGLHDASQRHSATTIAVERVVLHPDFQPENYNNDIALLRLNQQVALSKLVRPVCLPQPQRQVLLSSF